ncbi:MAG: RsmG family class I SAM-dependent methyltransferase [Myxococcota bacterium]
MPDLLSIHRQSLESWRGAMNLVGPGAIDEHYLDAERALSGLDRLGVAFVGDWADLGSGAGFPGIVFAARYPAARLDLIESRRKRCTFLEHVLGQAGVRKDQVHVRCERVEDLQDRSYDGILARAFLPPDQVLVHAARLLVPGGLAVLFLSTDQALPAHPAFTVAHQAAYDVGGRSRQVVAFARSAT